MFEYQSALYDVYVYSVRILSFKIEGAIGTHKHAHKHTQCKTIWRYAKILPFDVIYETQKPNKLKSATKLKNSRPVVKTFILEFQRIFSIFKVLILDKGLLKHFILNIFPQLNNGIFLYNFLHPVLFGRSKIDLHTYEETGIYA